MLYSVILYYVIAYYCMHESRRLETMGACTTAGARVPALAPACARARVRACARVRGRVRGCPHFSVGTGAGEGRSMHTCTYALRYPQIMTRIRSCTDARLCSIHE